MIFFVTIVHVTLSILLIAVVLLQHGKGADMGVALGGGGSQTVFGARGAGNFLTKLTAGGAILFMVTSLYLSYASGTPTASEIIGNVVPAESPIPPAYDAVVPLDPAPTEEALATDSDIPEGFEEIPPPAPSSEESGGQP